MFKRSLDELMEISLSRLAATPIKETGPGGIARLLLAIINANIAEFYDVLETNMVNAFVSTASGEYLDRLGELVNCKRLPGETDDNYRYRITRQVTAAEAANETAIRLAALSVPGVKDVLLRPYTYGPGSGSLYVVTDETNVEIVKKKVQEAVDKVKAWGSKIVVEIPALIPVEMKVKLIFDDRINEADKELVRQTAEVKLKDYINSRSIGEPLIINEIRELIMSSSQYIYDIEVLYFAVNDRPVLLVNQYPAWNERFVESSKRDAVSVSI